MNESRRKFLNDSFRASMGIAVGGSLISSVSACAGGQQNTDASDGGASGGSLVFSRIELPYGYDALAPNIDAETMDIHYNKHHEAYVTTVNEAIEAENVTYASEEELLANVSGLSEKIRNNAGGAWNHNFFWECLTPQSEAPSGKLADAITASFGSLDKFKEEFAAAAAGQFGSGWAWLIDDNGSLKIGSTPNQDNPLMDVAEIKGKPLLGLDVWEHAYYLKYQNKRADYIKNFWNVVNWNKVTERLG